MPVIRLPANKQGGFTLIEMMVALVVGLIVSGAAIAFLVSIAKVNKENLQVTRLTQELRAVSEVINREVRRARFVADPIGNVAQGAGAPIKNDDVYIGANCISVAYNLPPTETSDTALAPATVRKTIHLSGGRVYVNTSLAATCASPGVGEAISSPEVTISTLSFDNDTDTANALGAVDGFVRTVVAGRLTNAIGDLASVTRTYQQDAYIRSGKVNP